MLVKLYHYLSLSCALATVVAGVMWVISSGLIMASSALMTIISLVGFVGFRWYYIKLSNPRLATILVESLK